MAMVEKILSQRLAGGTSILLVTHAVDQARRLAVRRLQMTAGEVSEEAATEKAI